MLASLRPVTALLLSCFILICGQGLTTSTVPLGASGRFFPEWVIGLLGSAYFLGMLLGAFAAPFILRSAGHIRAFAALSSSGMASIVILPVTDHAIAWIFLRMGSGFCIAGLYATIESWIIDRTEDGWRARVLSVYNIVHFAGSGAGQQLLPLAPVTDFTLFALSGVLFALSVLPLCFTQADQPKTPEARRLRLGWLYKISPVGVVCSLFIGWANGSFWAMAPLVAQQIGFSAAQVATFMTAVILGCAMAQLPAGYLGDRFDRRIVLAAFAALAAVSQVGLAFAASFTAYCVLGFILGMAIPTLYVMTSAHTNGRAGRQHAVEVSSSILFLYCIGGLLGPLVAGLLTAKFGPSALFWNNAVADLAIVAYVLWRVLLRAPPPAAPIEVVEGTRVK